MYLLELISIQNIDKMLDIDSENIKVEDLKTYIMSEIYLKFLIKYIAINSLTCT